MRLWRARFSSFRFLCLRIFLRRFLITLPKIDPQHTAIQHELDRMGLRRAPMLGFMRRSHLVNRWLGRLRGAARPEPSAR